MLNNFMQWLRKNPVTPEPEEIPLEEIGEVFQRLNSEQAVSRMADRCFLTMREVAQQTPEHNLDHLTSSCVLTMYVRMMASIQNVMGKQAAQDAHNEFMAILNHHTHGITGAEYINATVQTPYFEGHN